MKKFKSRASIEQNELAWLLSKLQDIQPRVIVEIGVHKGYSLEVWRTWFKPDILIGIQDDISELDYNDADIIQGISYDYDTLQEVKLALAGAKIDFLFIDGDHSYDGIKADYTMYSTLMAKGGIIAFHDAVITDHPLVEVHQFIKELDNVEVYQKDGTGMAVVYA